jgi:hypothetical protein
VKFSVLGVIIPMILFGETAPYEKKLVANVSLSALSE